MRWAIFAIAVLLSSPVWAKQEVRVGAYVFAPFVELKDGEEMTGLLPDLLALLNQSQDAYSYNLVPTTARRRYRELIRGKFDVMFFEDPHWEWLQKGPDIVISNEFMSGGERYVAYKHPGRNQDYFEDLMGKRLTGMFGYHYSFAGYNNNPGFLREVFNMNLVTDPSALIDGVMDQTTDISVVTDSYLSRYLKSHPMNREILLISDVFDQVYSHRIISRKGFDPDAKEILKQLKSLEKLPSFRRLWEANGIHVNLSAQ